MNILDNKSEEVATLDQIPHGYMRLRGDQILYMNRMLISFFGGHYDHLSELELRYPEVSFLREYSAGDPATQWVDIGGLLLNVGVFTTDDSRTVCFMPAHYLAETDPGLHSLQQAYDDFVEIFQNCFDGIYVADGNGKTLWINDGFERCYGLSARNFLGRNASELERQGYINPLITWKVITTKQRTTALQTTKSGRRILATGIPLFDKNGRVRKVIINSRDTTELVELQSRLDEATREIGRYESEIARLRNEMMSSGDLVWTSDRMQEVVDLALRVAKLDTTLLITGESGVGKEVVANLIHGHSARLNAPLVQINCGAIPGELLESELFGYEDGAFTGSRVGGKKGLLELADGGTLFLDEIGELPVNLQVKLLRVLQDQAFTRVGGTKTIRTNFRIIAATNCNLKENVRRGTFREDLFYRLSVVPIEVPPLRDRPQDIISLSYHFLEFFNVKYGFSKKLSEGVMERFVQHRWPGNVRELRNLIERLVVTTIEDVVAADRIPKDMLSVPFEGLEFRELDEKEALSATEFRTRIRKYEATLLRRAVEQYGSIRRAAEATGISESTIKRKLQTLSA